MKKNTKALVAIFTGASLATMLVACTPNKKPQSNQDTIENVQEVKEEVTEEIIDKENTYNEKYFDQLKKDIEEVKEYGKEKLNSEEVKEKKEMCKEKLNDLTDFIFNGKEINGITFSELKAEEKRLIIEQLSELDGYINDYIPKYKERFNNWFSNKGEKIREWLVDKSVDVKELWEEYKDDVEEEYENRKSVKHM